MDRAAAERFLKALNPFRALAVDSMVSAGFRNEANLTPAVRERAEAWRRWARQATATDDPRLRENRRMKAMPRRCARAGRLRNDDEER